MLLHASREQTVRALRHRHTAHGDHAVRAELHERRLQRRWPNATNAHAHAHAQATGAHSATDATISNTTIAQAAVAVIRPR